VTTQKGRCPRVMLRLGTTSAKPGMTLALPVFHPMSPGHVLLRPGFVLDEPALRRLSELQVKQLWIRYPALDQVMRYISPEVVMQQHEVAVLVGRLLERVRDGRFAELDFRSYACSVRQMVSTLAEAKSAALLISDVVNGETPLALHSGAVCFLSLLMGLKLEACLIDQRPKVSPSAARQVENLGVGALLHDLGMQRVPSDALERWRATMDWADPRIEAHVGVGYEMVKGRIEPTAATAILQHHQRCDGSGFPRCMETEDGELVPMRAGQIHVFARVLAIADTFDYLRNPPEGLWQEHHRVPVVRVLRRMLAMARSRIIDPVAFKALLWAVPAYSPGSIVRLNNGRRGVVLTFDPFHPCKPVVRHVRHSGTSNMLDEDCLGETYELLKRDDLSIVEAEGHDVSKDQFTHADQEEFDIRVIRPPGRIAPVRRGPASGAA